MCNFVALPPIIAISEPPTPPPRVLLVFKRAPWSWMVSGIGGCRSWSALAHSIPKAILQFVLMEPQQKHSRYSPGAEQSCIKGLTQVSRFRKLGGGSTNCASWLLISVFRILFSDLSHNLTNSVRWVLSFYSSRILLLRKEEDLITEFANQHSRVQI